jgi:CRISPR-associated protein Cmr1
LVSRLKKNLALKVAQGETVTTHPDRVVFGLPHNYFFGSVRGAKVDVNPVGGSGKSEGRGRRASPLFIHLHEFPDGKCAAIQALLPARFLPPSDRIELKARQAPSQVSPQIDWDVIDRFLDRFKNRQRIYPFYMSINVDIILYYTSPAFWQRNN